MTEQILIAKNITKVYSQGDEKLEILKSASLEINKGEIVGLIGPSGSGKSTLLHILGLLDSADSGSVIINNKDCLNASSEEKNMIRSNDLGFIYQFHHLLPEFSALENVMMPLRIQGKTIAYAKENALEILENIGLGNRVNHMPNNLSGGEQQRVAIARAIATKPALILADEPTGNLDPINASNVFDLLIKMVREYDLSVLIITHNMLLSERMDKVLTIKEGKISEYLSK